MSSSKSGDATPPTLGHYLQLKGQKAEAVVHELARRSFLTDWCYPNPSLPDGKELCDLLVVYDDVAIVWSVKDLQPFKQKKADKGLKQLGGAKRQLFELATPIELENPRRGREPFDPSKIKEVFLISALMGEDPDFLSFAEEVREGMAHVLHREGVEILLGELDTISDFTEYLRRKQAFLDQKQEVILNGGEQELLAVYLRGGRSFKEYREADLIVIEEGHWQKHRDSDAYEAKRNEDEISYGWDSIVDRAHEGSAQYERVARELARPNRFERRVLAKSFFDAHTRAHEAYPEANAFRRVTPGQSATYCFLFLDKSVSREARKAALGSFCFVARGKHPAQHRVVGIATEQRFEPTCSYDFCLLEWPDWTEEHQRAMEKIQEESGILVSPEMHETHEDEYPGHQ